MNIKDFDHLQDDKRIRIKEENVNGHTFFIISYMIGDNDLWNKPLAAECRGITFAADGNCVCRPFHKFFNVNENQSTQLDDIRDRSFEILEKRDGSMITPVLVGDDIVWKSKKSFYSDLAIEAGKNVPSEIEEFSRRMIYAGWTPIFEYTSPNSRIVIDYGQQPEYVLLSMRDIESGVYLTYPAMEYLAFKYEIPLISRYSVTIDDCINEIDTLTDFEGWVLRDRNGFHCKLKTAWYLRNHRAKTELRERDVADMVVNETIDDIKSSLALDGYDLSPIEHIEREVNRDFSYMQQYVDHVVKNIKDKTDYKSIALEYGNDAYFNLIMSEVRGKEPDYKKYWKNDFRDTYGLNTVYSNFGGKNE